MQVESFLAGDRLVKHYPVKKAYLWGASETVHAVDDVSLDLAAGETVALVGESGCGKSTIARMLLGITGTTEGSVRFGGRNIADLKGASLREFRREVQIIFQDPTGTLNPKKTIYRVLRDPLMLHGMTEASKVRAHAGRLLERVGLSPAETYLDRYPHQLSGGQRQRVGIARAISVKPKFIVADEPVSALDVSIRAQILELLKDLQREQSLGYLLITHDLAVVRSIAHLVAVMYLGKIVEIGPVGTIFEKPRHPYTQALLAATPIPNPVEARRRSRQIISGEVPSAVDPPSGCRFRTRCPIAMPECAEAEPQLLWTSERHDVSCHAIHPIEVRAPGIKAGGEAKS